MIESAAKLSKLESIEELEKKTLDLKEVVEKASADVMPLLKTAGMEVENRLKKPLYVRANPIIEEVFLNLLNNAAKYTADGKRVVIDAIEDSKSVTVAVKDYGPGIPDEDKEEIFNRFERRDRAGVKGMGMGLTIVKRIVELHSGKVWVEDNPEGGSIFYVQLPK
jgi:signal transduction histidine kinase